MKNALNIALIILSFMLLHGCGSRTDKNAAMEDPYLWLEDIEGDTALNWVREQNRKAEEVLKSQPAFNSLQQRFLEVFNDKERMIYPNMVGGMVYNLWQDDVNERGIWRRMTMDKFLNKSKEWETVLDLDRLSSSENRKWVFHGADWFGHENEVCLLSLSDGGKDESVVREFDASTGKFVTGGFSIDESKGSSEWVDINTILVATDYGAGSMSNSGYPCIVKLWKRGADPAEAEKVLETDTTNMGLFLWGYKDKERRYSFIYLMRTFYDKDLFLYTPDGLKKIEIPSDAEVQGIFRNYILLYLQSDWTVDNTTFSKGSLVSFDLDECLKGNTIISNIYQPEEKASFAQCLTTSGYLAVATMENVQSRLKIYKMVDGKWDGTAVQVPEFGTVNLVSSDNDADDYFFTFSNPLTPPTLYHGTESDINPIRQQKKYFDSEGLTVEQFEVASSDGTIIPYFIIHPEEMKADGKNPTLIYGYGGFNISEQPVYSSVRGIGWLEGKGVYVIANIRGGGEFGPAWHQAALKEKRQNAYDDFFAVAEDIIKRGISSPEYMGMFGWSNGGLLAGVNLTQRPDLYNAVVIGAPLLDMKRYSKLLAGASWMAEYGDPDKPEEWEYIKKYSPYQNLKEDATYPEVLIVTSTKDDRVHPGHARKMAAKMIGMGHPLFYHETIEGGHGAASTNAQEADMWAMIYTYLDYKLKQ